MSPIKHPPITMATEEPSELETISQRVDDLITAAREDLTTALDEDYDWAAAAGQSLRLADLLRVRAIIAEYM